ncbi:MAG: MBOAT family O-acyltransferase [Phycisphaerae bacterium]|jgi:D-alanyl-lipoteichoic acid acyltransferase DltB (MBOAT superfamily)|nr:MBOAT family O-acyltransferase [Phycisphaerae bacterium]
MLFHTWTFLAFFLVVYPGFLLLKRTPLKAPWLLAGSYVFYGWWNPVYLLLIVWSTTIDYLAVIAMARTRWRKPWLIGSIVNNLFLLGFFKYGQFVVDSLNALASWLGLPFVLSQPNVTFLSDAINSLTASLGLDWSVQPFDYLLPVGISFYVFQSMSYTIDYYRGRVERETSFIRYATFVSLFPQLVAGPIERASNLLPQLQADPKITPHDVADGASLFIVGLFKKIALADYLAMYVNPCYAAPGDYGAAALLLATFAFAWQIYFDFSGYTDMARGIGRMMGFRLMLNFNNPYLADGLGDFWRRWHISLSTWFRDYVYVPLGGNRKGTSRMYVNMVLTMLVSGLWHAPGPWNGAVWTFVLWGAVHAAGRLMTRRLEGTDFYCKRAPRIVKQLLTFSIVAFAWIFFRANSVSDAWLIINRIATTGWSDPGFPLMAAGLVLAVWLYQYLYESRLSSLLKPAPVRIALVVAMIVYMAACVTTGAQGFIYFQF